MPNNFLWCVLLAVIPSFNAWCDTPEFKLGAIFSLSGYGETGGASELDGVRMAVDAINADGGIAGRKIKLIVEDSKSDLKATAQAVQKLTGIDKVDAVVGPNWAEFAEVAAPVVERSGIPMITASGYSKTLTSNRSNIFTLLESHRAIVNPLAQEIIRRGHKQVIILTSENQYFMSIAEALSEDLKAGGISIVKISSFNPTDIDFRSSIADWNKKKVDAVVSFLAEGPSQLAFFRQSTELKLTAARYSSNAVNFDESVKQNLYLLENVIFFEYELPGIGEFETSYKQKFTTPFVVYAAKSYDAVRLLKIAAEECAKKNEPAIAKCLAKADYSGVSGQIKFNARNEILDYRPVSGLFIVKNGAVTRLG